MITVSERTVEARVRRALLRDGEVLRKTRPGNTWAKIDFGDYYTVDPNTRFPERRHCDLEQLAREYQVLRPGEVVGE
jgi:hypothetical protein